MAKGEVFSATRYLSYLANDHVPKVGHALSWPLTHELQSGLLKPSNLQPKNGQGVSLPLPLDPGGWCVLVTYALRSAVVVTFLPSSQLVLVSHNREASFVLPFKYTATTYRLPVKHSQTTILLRSEVDGIQAHTSGDGSVVGGRFCYTIEMPSWILYVYCKTSLTDPISSDPNLSVVNATSSSSPEEKTSPSPG